MTKLARERLAVLLVTALLLWVYGPCPLHLAAALVGVTFFWWFLGAGTAATRPPGGRP